MLQKLRDKTTGWIAIAIVGLLIIPFALFGLEQYMVGGSSNTVATVEAPPSWWASAPSWWPASMLWRQEQITIDEFRSRFEQERRQQRAQQGEAFDARGFESVENKRAVLDTLIDQQVQAMASEAAGIVVGDALVRQTIREIPAFQVDGKFDVERYQLALASQVPRQTPSQFDQLIREGLQETLVSSAVVNSNFVTESEMQRLIELMGQRRDVSLVMLPAPTPATGEDAEPVSDAQIQAWYEAHAAQYRAPETVSIKYVELDATTMPAPPPATEADLRARFEQEGSRFAEQAQRLASHILVRVEEGADEAVVAAARREAQQLAEQARADGADFAALARANSDDVGSKASGGDLGWVGKGMMVGPFEDALFALEPGQVSDPVRTDFGWHVIKLRDIKAGDQAGFEQVRDTLAREQAQADRERQFNEVMGRLIDEVYKNPSSLAPAARELGLEVQQAGPFSRQAGEGVAAYQPVKRSAFSEAMIEDGMVSDALEIGPGHSVLIRVTGHTPERARPLSDVRDQVVAAIRADRARQAALARADALLERLRGDQTLVELAEAESLPAPQVVPSVPRNAPLPEIEVTEAVFAAPAPTGDQPTAGKAVLGDGRIVLFTVDKVTPGDIASVPPQQRQQLRQQIGLIGGTDNADAMLSALRKRMQVTVFEDKL